ncbi:hypothetical protein F0U44_00060 [Nocardioides humilatus]|uniref:Exo-alpha-sialidase n=1 Tax=Nocardioides humilatus TaxID=2607660 RepID=A0A5B1LJZ1_9ACTN|nr:hypothetical protein [Nocardioides humilatus]KAA1420786.1 hypothetical protein F0U44_00060 [Nocardioides humilatus]
MRTLAAIGALLLPVVLSACGEEPSGPQPAAAEPGEWGTEHLNGELAVDFPTLLVTERDDALVLMLSDDGVLQSHLSTEGGRFVEGEPLDLGEQYAAVGDAVRLADGSWLALGNAGTVEVDGDEEFTYDPLALRSDDGLVWERVEATGFSDPVEFNDIEVVDDQIVAVGAYRTLDDPGMGGFEARAWTSTDGKTFDEVALPDVPDYRGYDDESYAGDVVVVDDALLVSGRIGGTAALWRTSDNGATWSRVAATELRDVYSISGLGAVGSSVVATTAGSSTAALRSDDGGATWEPVDALPLDDEAEGWAPLWVGAGRFFTLTGVDDMSWSQPEVCYADIEQCSYDQQPRPQVVVSADGATWTGVELPGEQEPDEIVGTADGRVLIMVAERGGVAVHTWPADADLPVAEGAAGPETVELVTVPEGERPEVGVRYHAPMFVHCGMDWFWFGDGTWRRTDDGPDVETGAGDGPPAGWPLAEGQQTLYGYATVTDDGHLDYSLEDGTVIATYERRSGAPGCD